MIPLGGQVMPPSVLLPLVVFGITGIVLLVHLTGNSAPLLFRDESQAKAAWVRHFPDLPAATAHISDDLRAALIDTGGGAGITWSLGADSTARMLTPACMLKPTKKGLLIHFHDFTAPNLKIALDNDQARQDWISLTTKDAQT